MTTQELFQSTRLTHVRALKDENAQLRAELVRVREENAIWQSHFALAMAAAREAEGFPEGTELFIVDGWNAILGAEGLMHGAGGGKGKSAGELEEFLLGRVRAALAERPSARCWVVFDGSRAAARTEERLRITWTGGTGAHRADRFTCDYLRMRRIVGASGPVTVVTDDRDFRKSAVSLGAETLPVRDFLVRRSPPAENRIGHHQPIV